MKTCTCISFLILLFISCKRDFTATKPTLDWDLFDSPTAQPITSATRQKLEGVYTITKGSEDFGDLSALKWSYTASGTDTTYHLSFFCENQSSYFICEGKRLNNEILLNGYWRKLVNTETGRIRLTISADSGATYLLQNTTTGTREKVVIKGVYGFNFALPDIEIRLEYTRPLFNGTPLEIIAHRGGGRTADLLPASENSVEIIKLASQYGASGIEIDVQLTKDGVPVLFHDATLNERVIQKNGLLGGIENYTYDQLYSLVRLINGERIPTLREALRVTVENTPIKLVWLDIKFQGSLQQIRQLQEEYIQKAAAMGRSVEILIGIPDENSLKNLMALPGYQTIPSIVELTTEDVRTVNAKVWAPRWTRGLLNEEVAQIQSEGRKAYVWTLDIPDIIQQYLREGRFNGILSNYPSAVAYYYYTNE